jgi:uncharacterized protein (TIGR03067 family)
MRVRCVTLLTIAAAFCLVAANPAKEQQGKKKDKDLIQGTWKAVTGEQAGMEIPEDALKQLALTIKVEGDKYTFDGAGQNEEGKIKLDSEKKPKAIDFIIESGMDKGKTQLGIYSIDGGKFKLCVAKAGETDRPTEFKTKEGGETSTFVFKKG